MHVVVVSVVQLHAAASSVIGSVGKSVLSPHAQVARKWKYGRTHAMRAERYGAACTCSNAFCDEIRFSCDFRILMSKKSFRNIFH